MFSGRMLNVLQYIHIKGTTSYKETADALHIKDRSVRYDVDRINDSLSVQGKPVIEKLPKGVLRFPPDLSLDELSDGHDFLYTGSERVSLLLLNLLIRNENFKISQMSRDLQVSRSTIKNDMNELSEMLKKDGLSIEYKDHFYLAGPKKKRVPLLNQEFNKYIDLLINPPVNFNAFEYHSIHIIHSSFHGASIPRTILCVNEFLEKNDYVLTDSSYRWYLSNVLCLVWFAINKKEYPLSLTIIPKYQENALKDFQKSLSEITGCSISWDYMLFMVRYLEYTQKYSNLNKTIDLVYAESLVYSLVSRASKAFSLPFEHDGILIEGLLSHIVPLLERIESKISICENMIQVLGKEELEIYPVIKNICLEIEPFREIENEDEFVYFTIYFLASMKRLRSTPHKRILLVCGHGYGTTTMLKETLLSEYQVHIVDTIPIYKVASYPYWSDIDFILSTANIHGKLPKPYLLVHPILKTSDYMAIEKLGIPRKKLLSNYYRIGEKLNFLSSSDKAKVMDILGKELGYQTIDNQTKMTAFSSLLKFDCIQIVNQPFPWKDAVAACSAPLLRRRYINQEYIDHMITDMEKIGFYSITDDSFALLHGKAKEGVTQTSLSLIVNKQPVHFGDKQVKIIFCLAAKNSKDHIPAVVSLMRMVKMTSLIQDLENSSTIEEIYQHILTHEFEVS
jgi:activator of the mannose operon (transcriptional antiterminator)